MQKTILCYGDSNTWGYIPQDFSKVIGKTTRYSRDKRWPGILQLIMGSDFYVIEEGLNSRTTNVDYHIPPDRNGKRYLLPCLYSHSPVDVVILALGGNDLKSYFNREAEDIKLGLADLIDDIKSSNYGPGMSNPPEILVIPPIIPTLEAEDIKDENGILILRGAVSKAKNLVNLYSELSKEKSCMFIDITKHIYPSIIDGIHLDDDNHRNLANIISEKLRDHFKATERDL